MDFRDKRYHFEPGEYNGKRVIWIRFEKDNQLISYLRNHTKARWSASEKSWYITDNRYYRELFGLKPVIAGKEVLRKIHAKNLPALKRFQEQIILKGYSENTLRTYTLEFAQLLYILKSYPVDELTPDRLRGYFLYCHRTLKLSESEIHSRINAIKFYYEQVLHREKMFFDIPRPKKPQTLPKMLNKKEVQKIIEVTQNPKHRLMLKLAYGMGLRVSELVSLKISDIDSTAMLVRIEQGKGKKDRVVPLPESVLEDMRSYYKDYRPKIYLFEGQHEGQYSIRSAQQVFKSGLKKAGIKKQIGIHGLRHSYATHLLETGTDIRFIKDLLGHQSVKTTEIYTHVTDLTKSKIKSPLDSL
jgi:site-specific recombinase XerD